MYETAVSEGNQLGELLNLEAEVYATTRHGELAFLSTQVINTLNSQVVFTLPVASTVMTVTGNQQKLFLYDEVEKRLRVISMSQIADLAP